MGTPASEWRPDAEAVEVAFCVHLGESISRLRPDLSQRGSFTCPECRTEGVANIGAAEESEEVEVACDCCQRVVLVALGGEDA